MNIGQGLKVAQIGVKGLGKGLKRGGTELALLAGKGIVIGLGTTLLGYLAKENQTEVNILATKNAKEGFMEMQEDLNDILKTMK